MEFEALIKKMKEINSALLNFIEADDDSEDKFKKLIKILENQEILQVDEVRLLFQLISKIADNHHRGADFFDKLERIIKYFTKDTSLPISHYIPDYTNYNERFIYLLLEKKLIKPDDLFINQYLQNEAKNQFYYLYPVMKEFLEEEMQKQIENKILEHFGEELSTFEKKFQIGENDSYICSLIRSDLVEEFVAYVNRTNLPLLSTINPSIYETNLYLIGKKPTLIEYAAFFGSIQIIQYLNYNNVPLTFDLWEYAVHSNNPELIHFMEENINQSNGWYDLVLIESIKCHHNEISNYIKDNLMESIQENDQTLFFDNFY